MYFKQNFFRLTKFQRKIPMRRKHLHNWLVYFNFLYSWLGEYRHFKTFYKSTLNQNLFINNITSLNYSAFLKTSLFPFSLFAAFKGAKLLKNQNYSSISNSSTIVLTSASRLPVTSPLAAVQFLYLTNQKIHTPYTLKKLSFKITTVFQLMTLIQLLILKEVYRIFTLTLLLN